MATLLFLATAASAQRIMENLGRGVIAIKQPNGKIYVPQEEVKLFLAPLAIQKMPMVGDVTARFMRDMGIHTIGQLMNFPSDVLTKVLGKNGYSLWERANGIDHSPVVPYSEAKSLSTEQTFHTDTTDMRFLHTTFTAMVEELSYKLRAENYMTSCVAVKIRYSNFDTKTQQITIPYTSREDVLLKAIYDLFQKCFDRRLLIRLVGIRFSKLVNANYQLTLFDQAEKKVNLMFAMDKIRDKFGVDKISRVDGLFSLGGKRKKSDNFFNPKSEK